MERLCEKCRRLVDAEQCPFCGNPETREPEDSDFSYLGERSSNEAMALAEALQLNGIHFRTQKEPFSARREKWVFFVPYGRLEDAEYEIYKLWNSSQPAAGEHIGASDADVFSADEIDRMDTSLLDDMDPKQLKAYKNKILKTLREIKVQEKKWKQRTILLLDMKEEAENLIEDLS